MRKKQVRAAQWTGMAISAATAAAMLPAQANACMYHWLRGLQEPTGIWPTDTPAAPVDADAALAQLQMQDALDDAAINHSALGGGSVSTTNVSGNVSGNVTGTSGGDTNGGAFASPLSQPADTGLSPAITSWWQNTTIHAFSTNTTVNSAVSSILVNVQTVAYNSSNAFIKATGVPYYNLGPFGNDPNTIKNVNLTYEISLNPTPNTGTKTPTGLGAIGVAVNGVGLFNPWDGMSYNNDNVWQQNANVFEASTFDIGPGHPAPGGEYHYHEAPATLINQLDPGNTGQHASPVIGYAADGYPIFGPYGYVVNASGQVVDDANGNPEVELMTSSYQLRNITTRTTLPNGTTASAAGPAVSAAYPLGDYLQDYTYNASAGTLDQYNGRFAVAPGYPNGTYGYYVTETYANGVFTPTYPYIIGPDYYGNVNTADTTPGSVITIPANATYYVPPVPEPGSVLLLGSAAGMTLLRRRNHRR